jgi:hypothetical protein
MKASCGCMTLRNPELEIELQLCEHYVTLTVSPTGSLCCVMCAFGTMMHCVCKDARPWCMYLCYVHLC